MKIRPELTLPPSLPVTLTRILLRASLLVLLAANLTSLASCQQTPPPRRETLNICGSAIDFSIDRESSSLPRQDLTTWIRRAGDAVCTYYGKFPIPHMKLDVRIRGGAGVHGGVTYPDGGGYTQISLGENTTVAQLNDDWMLTHEMIHLAFPSMARRHHWIEEGISVYVEPIARVQAGQLTAERMWHDVVRDMPQGEPESGDRGMDNTHTWGRTYWGGAMFCLVADVRIRQQTHNKKGLQDALRGILNAGGTISEDWDIEKAFTVGDKATGTTVLSDLYRETKGQPSPVDLNALWKQLGISRDAGGAIQFDSHAPLADVRLAITRAPAGARH